MKKFWLTALLLTMLFAVSLAEPVTYQGFTADTEAVHLSMDGVKVTNWNSLVTYLHQFPNLKRCDMYDTITHLKEADLLSAEFPDVQFGWTLEITGCDRKHVFRSDVTAFSTLHSNKTHLHASSEFEIFKYCPNLLALDVGHNAVDDLSFLQYTPNLKVLIVACNHLTDITPIGQLKDLEYLEIFKNKITDISVLANLTNLIDLNICFNNVKDWSPLLGLTNLERLWLYNSNNYSESSPVPTAIVTQLKEALPNTYVDAKSYSTAGGWREHERYSIVNTMFNNYSYIPFKQDGQYIRRDGKTAEYTHPVDEE